jgi:hypothetical protein
MTIITDQSDIIYSICETEYNSYVSAGYTYTYGAGNMDIWLLNIGNINNQPPNKPAKPSGPTNGKAGEEHTYSSSTTDPDGDQIQYWFDWGNGENSGWIGPFDSGVETSASHIWNEKGNYEIKVKAKDIYGVESEWSDPLSISMPKNKIINPFERFLENHPHMFPMMRHLLRLMN